MYCSVEDLRAAGVSAEQADDERLSELIGLSCDYIDRITGQWFEPRTMAADLDGCGGAVLPLPVFCIRADSVEVDGAALDAGAYLLRNSTCPHDCRPYPRIVMRRGVWPLGIGNVRISGLWGYVDTDADGEPKTPPLIRRAAMKLALYNFPDITDPEAVSENNTRGALLRETTDGHSYELSEGVLKARSEGALTGDREIDDILVMFTRRRLNMGAV